jgi:uncharacterized membrane protein (UPF0127 family)
VIAPSWSHAVVLALACAALGCRPGNAGERGGASGPAGTPRVRIDSPSARSSVVTVELARTPAEIERGLMFRERLAPDAGMLFVFPTEAEHVFWMKNTPIALDMIFADAQGVVIGIVERAEPLTETLRSVGAPSRYVLEVNAGWSAAHGIAAGDRMRFEGFEP